ERAVDAFTDGDDVSAAFGVSDDVVFAGLEWFALVNRLAGFIENIRHWRACAKEKTQAGIAEDLLDTPGELVLVGGGVEARGVLAVTGLHAAVGEHAVDPEVAGVVRHVVHAAVAEMRQHVREIQARHGDFADAHLKKSAERRVNALLALGVSESSSGGEISAF